MESVIAARDTRPAKASAILLLEADPLMRGLLREWLAGAGHTVSEAGPRDGVPAEAIGLVIVDLYMPREAGARIIRAVQRSHPGTPVIAISGQFRPGLAATSPVARALGAARILAKPFSREDLLLAVQAIIGPPT